MHILVNYASRSRPGRFLEGLESIFTLAARKEDITVLCALDADDPEIHQYRAFLRRHANELGDIRASTGKSTSKIDAINRMSPVVRWDILVNFSDDMRFTVYGWDILIRDAVGRYGPDVFLHFPDSTAKAALPTMAIMDSHYYARDSFVYHPSYASVFCDNESMEVAQRRGRYHYIDTQIYDHFHPAYGHVPWDEQYTRQQSAPIWTKDQDNYNHRKANNFFLDDHLKYIDSDDHGTAAKA